jgi:hypothetical protein
MEFKKSSEENSFTSKEGKLKPENSFENDEKSS